MKFKKAIAGIAALALTLSAVPRLETLHADNLADRYSDNAVFYSADGLAVPFEGNVSAEPNAAVITKGDFSYMVQPDGTIYISDYNREIENVVFPSEMDGKTVTRVRVFDASGKKHVTVTIPASVTNISFSVNSGSILKEIIVDEKNKNYASKDGVLFNKDFTTLVRYPVGKSTEEPEYTLPDTVNTVNGGFSSTNMTAINATDKNPNFSSVDGVLYNKDKTSLIVYPRCKSGTAFVVPKTVTSIVSSAFSSCENLASVTLQEGLKTIKSSAFNSCTKITSIAIPASVSEIANGAFAYSYLESITVNENNKDYFTEKGVLFNKDASILILYPPKKSDTAYTVPDTVETIGRAAFTRSELSEITFGKSLSAIEGVAFQMCRNITSVVLPDGIKVIDHAAFADCSKLSSVTIPADVERLSNVTMTTDNYNGYMNLGDSYMNIFVNCSKDLVIQGTPGTVAEKYALYWGIQFNENPTFSDNQNNTGVTIMAPEGSLPENTVLNVEKVPNEDNDEVSFNITLTSNGKEVQPNGKVTVKIPVPAGFTASECKVFYKDPEGNYTDMKAVNNGNYLVFTTDHFSEYVVTAKDLAPKGKLGDVYKDGEVDIRDARKLLQAVSGNIELTAEEKAVADVYADGSIDIRDARMLLQAASGSIEL